MADKVSPTLRVLQEIRDELKQHRALLQEHRGLLQEHGTRLGALERRQGETETRLATELIAVAHAVTEVRDLLRDRLDQRDRIEDLAAR
ncbi:MAG: hypothetical protein HY909_22270 [Deltaproteobacteria bacterium]|nr:hypothetical protein [Deltaproteobacteria bacterium]